MSRAALLLLPLLVGCRSYLVAFDERPLPAPRPLDVRSGERLDLDAQGALVLRPAPGDVSAALGVGLAVVESGLLVTHRLRPDARLEPGDVIVHAAAALPRGGEAIRSAHRQALQEEARGYDALVRRLLFDDQPGMIIGDSDVEARGAFDAFDPAALPVVDYAAPPGPDEPPPPPAGVRARAGAHPVASQDDLRGYLVGHGWATLDLVVLRREAEVVVRQPLREAAAPLPVQAWSPERTRWHGFDVVFVEDLDPRRRPVHATTPDDLLVVRVSRDSPAGRAGLRPLDLVPWRSMAHLLGEPAVYTADGHVVSTPGHVDDEVDHARVIAANGREKTLRVVPRQEPTELWIPLLVSYQSDGVRRHLGLGPLDLLFHYSRRLDYVTESDSYEETWRWAFGTSIQAAQVEGAGGERTSGGVNLISTEGARLTYWLEWLDADAEGRRRRGAWSE